MIKVKSLCTALIVAAAVAAAPLAQAQTVHFAAAGSSAMFQIFAVAVINDIAGANVHHFTTKGNCGGGPGGHCADIFDNRTGVGDHQGATFWVAWQCSSAACTGSDATDIWMYAQVDSTVGVREFLARPSGVIATANPPTAQNLIPNALLTHNPDAGDAATIPADVLAVLTGGVSVTAGMTDIRAEDAYYATERVLNGPYNSDGGFQKLGFGEGVGIQGATSITGIAASSATGYAFSLPGSNDPHSGTLVPTSITTLSVGESPIVFIVNRSNAAGLGTAGYTNLVTNYNSPVGTANPLGQLFGGVNCNGNASAFGSLAHNFPVYPILREPLSGTMNTTEYSAFNTFGGKLPTVAGSEVGNSPLASPSTSQEANSPANVAPPNPLDNTPCAAGTGARYRMIGTGNEVAAVKAKADSIGYTFFSFGNINSIGASASYGYLTVDGVDPLYASYTTGQLPKCTAGTDTCDRNTQWPGGAYYPHLVDGTYRIFSLLRAVCDNSSASCSGADALGLRATIQKAQQDIHNDTTGSVADFLPFDDAGAWSKPFGDAKYVRSHYFFNSSFGSGTNNQFPTKSHTAAPVPSPLSITTDYSAAFGHAALTDVVADLPSDTNGTANVPEAGGDAGGCLISTADTGAIMTVQAAGYPAPVDGKIKFYVTVPAGATQPHGVCDAAASAPATPGMTCTTSYQAPLLNSSCGTVSTCNPTSTGDSMVVTNLGGAGSNGQPGSVDNGVFQITRFVNPGQIKVKAPIGRAGDPVGGGANKHYANLNPGLSPTGYATFNTGCAQ